MPLLFALAGIALTASAIAEFVRRRRVDYSNTPPDLRFLHRGFVWLLVGAAAACFLLAPALTTTPLGRGCCALLGLLALLRLEMHFRNARLTQESDGKARHSLLSMTLVYLAGLFLAAASGTWQTAPVSRAPVPANPPAQALSAEWLQEFWAQHAPDGHVHEGHEAGLPHAHAGLHDHGDGHAHAHAGEPLPHEVPIVEYRAPPTHGRHGGLLVRLSRQEEPDAGFVELKLANDAGALDVWLLRNAQLIETLDLPASASLRLRFLEREGTPTLDLRASEATKAVGSGSYFVFRPDSRRTGAWLQGAGLPALLRLELSAEGKVYVSDDFELYPRGHALGR